MPAADLDRAREIVLQGLGGRRARVYVFGSQARGDAWRGSDIDIAIDAGEPLPQELLAELAGALEESDILPRVDLVDLSSAGPSLRRRVREEGILWAG
jgi:hypothetical protein